MAEHKDKPFYIMKDEHSPMKSDWPNNIKEKDNKTDDSTEEQNNE